MQAKELMIGDWLKVNYEEGITETIKVESIYNHSGYYRVNDDNIAICYCEPIPLTEDILKANGWRNAGCYADDHDDMYYALPDNQILIISVVGLELRKSSLKNPHGTYNYDICRASVTLPKRSFVQFEYVHELQHALRLCGFNDLAENFQV